METRSHAVTCLRGITLAVAMSLAPAATLWADLPKAAAPPSSSKADMQSVYGHLPLSFEANQGQTDSQVNYLAHGQGYTLLLTPSEAVLALRPHASHSSVSPSPSSRSGEGRAEGTMLRLKLLGAAHTSSLRGLDELPGKVNYFTGNNPEKWHTNVPTFAKVTQPQVYPGIDVVYYGNPQQLEFDFIVAPGADPSVIRLKVDGADRLEMDAHGDLLLHVSSGSIQLQQPHVYQEMEGVRSEISGHYVINDAQEVSFQVANYDTSQPLIIDPALFYSTYLGGSADDRGLAIAVDGLGNAYVTGYTLSSNFPTTAGVLQPTSGGNYDVFVTKLNPTGSALAYSTYLSGSGEDRGQGIAVDTSGNAYVAGYTLSTNFPTTAGAFQTTFAGSVDAFVTKLNPTGSALVYSTYLSGHSLAYGFGIAVDASGNAHVTGAALTIDFPTTTGAFQTTLGGSFDAFVTKLNPTGSALVYSTYLGGTGSDYGFGIALDDTGNAYVTGRTFLANFPTTVGAFQTTFGGDNDAFVTKLNPTGSGLVYSTYLGGDNYDIGYGIAADGLGNAYVTGIAGSSTFPTTPGAFQTTFGSGGLDAFVAKVNPTGSGLVYSTYLGGIGEDYGFGIAINGSGNAYVTGYTVSTNFPITPGAFQATFGGYADAFVTKLNPSGSGLVNSTYLGGNNDDEGFGIAVDASSNAYVTGLTNSTNFPITAGAFQNTAGGGIDAFVANISIKPRANAGPDQSVPQGTLVTLDGTGSSGDSLTYSWTKVAGPTVALSGATSAHPTFSAPNVPPAGATVTFELVVCEGTSSNCSDPDSVNVHITNVNHPPVSQAGPDQTVQAGSTVILNGTASYDPDMDTLTYQWSQILGPGVTLMNPTTATASFTAPSVAVGGATMEFDLTVKDPQNLTGSDKVSVFVTHMNQTPVANAGPDQTVNENTLITLSGSGSTDPDLDALTYSWTQTAGPSVALTGGTTASPTVTAPSVGAGGTTLTFRLVVSDGQASSVADTVNIRVLDIIDPPVCSLAQPSVSSLWPPNHTMVPVSIMGVTDPNNQAITFTYPAVTQDEPVNGLGDGDTSPDAAVSGNQILLRAERSGNGNGRVYAVHFTATDTQGASCNGTVKVSVPHDKKDTAGEGPQSFNSFTP